MSILDRILPSVEPSDEQTDDLREIKLGEIGNPEYIIEKGDSWSELRIADRRTGAEYRLTHDGMEGVNSTGENNE